MAAATRKVRRRGSPARFIALLLFLGGALFLVYTVPSVRSAVDQLISPNAAAAKTAVKQQNQQDPAAPADDANKGVVPVTTRPAQDKQAEAKAREEALRKLESEAQAAKAKDDAEAQVVSVYRVMLPQKAAASLSVLDDQTAVLVLRQLPSEQAALILAQLDPTRAAALVKRILAAQ